MTRADVAVVGSGIVGLGIAEAALRRGLSVVVVDHAAEPHGASVRNFGHLCLTPQSGLAREFAAVSRAAWLRLGVEAGFPVRRTGTLVAARHDDELRLLSAFAAEREGAALFGDGPEIELLERRDAVGILPVDPDSLVGAAHLPYDLQVDPRHAAGSVRRHLADRGVDFRFRTAATGVAAGRLETSRGPIDAGVVLVAANHDVDRLLPEFAEERGIVRCALDMLRILVELRVPLPAPLLTGWSLVRYSGFAGLPEAAAVRARLVREHPELAELDVNLMATAQADGSLLFGDTHRRGVDAPPFRREADERALLAAAEELFGVPAVRVVERWQGVYAQGREDYAVGEVRPGVHVATVTTGIGMTTGFGLAEFAVGLAVDGDARPRRTEWKGNAHDRVR